MLTRPSDKELKALCSLRVNSDWETVRVWIEKSLAETQEALSQKADEVELRWNQGAAQILAGILDNAENAATKLKQREGKS